MYVHEHDHTHAHNHDNLQAGNHDHKHKEGKKENTTPWFLFIIFVLGPCEVLIPLLIYPAARIGMSGVAIVSFVFSIATVATMLTVVVLLSYGLKSISFGRFEKYTNVIAGAAISLSGIAIIYLGL